MRNFTQVWKKLPARDRSITVSTTITLMRIALTPVLVVLLYEGYWTAAFWFFVLAALTDVLDGALARLLNEQTFLGACLDPIADKILIVSSFATLAWVETPFFPIPHWFVWMILFKELILVLGAIFLYMNTGTVHIAPTRLGKITTFVQICFITWLFVCYFFSWVPVKTYWMLLIVLLCMVAASLFQYSRIGFTAWSSSAKKDF